MTKPLAILFVLASIAQGTAFAQAEVTNARSVFDYTRAACENWNADGDFLSAPATGEIDESPLVIRGRTLGTRYRVPMEGETSLELDIVVANQQPRRFISHLFNGFGDPLVLIALDSVCRLQLARRINYSIRGQAVNIVDLGEDLLPLDRVEWLNPPLALKAPETGRDPASSPLRVGLVDSGVDYRLDAINRRLARDADGELIGFDFWDMDAQPFDANPMRSGFAVQRHGTRTASILLREAAGIELVPYRYPRPDMSRMRALIEHAVDAGVRIIGMPIGSNRPEDWIAFERAARDHPQLLFIVSAGNNGRNIDDEPVYPAALGLDNMLVVTSADDYVRPAERTNWGRVSVDYLLPAEAVEALDYDGRETRVSGSSYAVSRAVALAARMLQQNRQWRAAELIAEFRRRFDDLVPATRRWVSGGYIPDPLAGNPVHKEPLPPVALTAPDSVSGYRLPLDVLLLDPRWSYRQLQVYLGEAFEILSQCGVVPGNITVAAMGGDEYLRDLTTGHAHTLLQAAGSEHLTAVFARDTRMLAQFDGEAFGSANTGRRPWLRHSVWLMLGVDDPAVALAHELFHVLTNSGEHVDTPGNLMQGRTTPDGVDLTDAQCERLQTIGVSEGLIEKY